MGPRNPVLDGVHIPHGNGQFVTYLRMSALRNVRLSPRANVPQSSARMGRQDGDAAFCQITLDTCFGST